jgi:hypothetical protein
MIFALQTDRTPRPTYILLVVVVLCICAARLFRWLFSGPIRPDPWDEQTASDLREGNCTPICHRCLNPHDPLIYFCPECGAGVGKYTNLLPYPYIFSLGHTLRIGTTGTFRRSPLIIIGFMVVSSANFFIIAPFYWVRLFLNILNQSSANTPVDEVNKNDPEEP